MTDVSSQAHSDASMRCIFDEGKGESVLVDSLLEQEQRYQMHINPKVAAAAKVAAAKALSNAKNVSP